ncbi:MAG: hypothetical protein AAF594_07085 [Bacteroidota bacterium]
MRVPPLHVAAGVLGMLLLAGCTELSQMFRPPVPVPVEPMERTFDLPEGYDIVDLRYGSDLVARDSTAFGERTTVQVFAAHRETGEEVLFVYDLAADGARPATVIRFRRAAPEAVAEAEPEPEPTPVPVRRRW